VTPSLWRYGILGLPVGFVGLPLYVHLPKFYADTLPLSLTVLGLVLFLTRVIDCLADPFLGILADGWAGRRRGMLVVSGAVLVAGVFGLFFLPILGLDISLVLVVGGLLVLTYLAYSVFSIVVYTVGVALGGDSKASVRVAAAREGMIIVGVLVASALPPTLTPWLGEKAAYQAFCWVLLVVVVVALLLMRLPKMVATAPMPAPTAWRLVLQDRRLRRLFLLFFLNALAPSLTATLFLFFASDVLDAAAWSGAFLGAYFLAAVLAMPVWVRVAARFGKRRSLIASFSLAIASFIWAFTLGQGDAVAFGVICLLSGAALGGDLAVLPSLLADAVQQRGASQAGGLEFGIWNFISKFTLALAAGIALPLLEVWGYAPGGTGSVAALSAAYALLPCGFKLAALVVLVRGKTL
jgi:GPH family glycoside/pentoside/hexuronide:cation symporter